MASIEGLQPVELVVLQGTSLCNLNCEYCDLSAESRRTKSFMPPALIERFFTELFESGRAAPKVTILWHSGEPLTLPPSYYDNAIDGILKLKTSLGTDNISLRFGIQTNGTLIDDNWCQFFIRHAHHLDVGVSCDGPRELHDLFRVNWNNCATHQQTLRGMDLLQKAGIKYKLIAVITRETLHQPDRFYKFFFDRREQLSGFHFNVLANSSSPNPALSYSPDNRAAYYSFYRQLLELNRVSHDHDQPFQILNFTEATARIVASKSPGIPSFFEQTSAPLRSLNLDAQGNVTTFYAGLSIDTLPHLYGDGLGLSLGNVLKMSLEEMAASAKLQRMMEDFALSKQACQSSCEYFSVCSGGFDLLKRQSAGTFGSSETVECLIHVKTLVDAVLDDIEEHVQQRVLNASLK